MIIRRIGNFPNASWDCELNAKAVKAFAPGTIPDISCERPMLCC
jgi:hypothetical protein